MGEIERIAPAEARRKAMAGEALLVCAYESEEVCGKMLLEGALSLGQFQDRLSAIDKQQQIVFYCA